jgi:putative mRNA 3-end processing factor
MHGLSHPLVAWTDKGLYCEAGNFYVDPHRAVENAVVTHAHSDHARRGSRHYWCEVSGLGLLHARLGKKIEATGLGFGEPLRFGDVTVSLHSAGHILGSAQVRIQRGSEVWVCSGDYKRDPDPSCEPFEVVPCDTFITEATFGTPKFSWNKSATHGEDIASWWRSNRQKGFSSVVAGYSLGKGQRILAELHGRVDRPVLIHSTMEECTQVYREVGRALAETRLLDHAIEDAMERDEPLTGELILAPPSVLSGEWAEWIGPYRSAFASGWMQGHGSASSRAGWGRGSYDHGFVMSDHADWPDLNRTIRETGASRVFVQHRNGALIRHLRECGIEAYASDDLVPERYARLPQKTLSLFESALRGPLLPYEVAVPNAEGVLR